MLLDALTNVVIDVNKALNLGNFGRPRIGWVFEERTLGC